MVLRHGWPIVVEMSETVEGPPEVVWDLITDWERQPDWMLEMSDVTVVSDHREGVGVEAEATVKIGGVTTRDKVRVVGWEPGHRLAIEHLGWVSGRGEIFLTPLGENRTHVFWREQLDPPVGMLGALGMTTMKPMMYRIFKKDLRVLAALVGTATRARSSEKPPRRSTVRRAKP